MDNLAVLDLRHHPHCAFRHYYFGYNLSGGSVITAILVHDTFNAGGAPLHDFLGTAKLRQHFDLIVACAFLLTATALIASTRGNLAMKSTTAEYEDAA